MFTIRGPRLVGMQIRPRPLEMWRSAAQLVWTRWEDFLQAPPETRARAFAAYLSALDAEAAAAAEMALAPSTSRA